MVSLASQSDVKLNGPPPIMRTMHRLSHSQAKQLRVSTLARHLQAPAPTIPSFADASTETVLHIVEKHIDYNYDWNEWSLRRKAIQVGCFATACRKPQLLKQNTHMASLRCALNRLVR